MSLGHGASITRSGLVLHIDAANRKSYPGSGTAVYDLSAQNNVFTINDAAGYISSDKVFRFYDTGVTTNWITTSTFTGITPGNVTDFTSINFFKVTYANSNKLWTFDDLNQDTNYRLNYYPTYYNCSGEINNQGQNLNPFAANLSQLNTWACYIYTISNSGLTHTQYRWNPTTNAFETTSNTTTIAGQIGTHVTFGRRGYNLTGNTIGLDMGPVLMYNRVLSINEIIQVFNAFRGRYGL